jgi:hypothetical protein
MMKLFPRLRRWSRPTPKARAARLPLELEALDARILPSATASLQNGVLAIVADANPDNVQVSLTTPDNNVLVTDTGTPIGTFAADQVGLIVFRNGASVSTYQNTTGIPDKQLRLSDSYPLTPDELSQTGTLDALMLDGELVLTGPSGAGFEVLGNWTDQVDQVGDQYQHTFLASGPMALRTGLGDIPFPAPSFAPLTVTTQPDAFIPGFGHVAAINWASDSVPLINTSDPASPLSTFASQYGLMLTTPGVGWGVELGSDLSTYLSGLDNLPAPVNSAVPYIFFTINSGYAAQFGQLSANPNGGDSLVVAFDPEDPSLFVHVNEFAVGVSAKGYLPYTPLNTLPGLDTNPIYGQLYGRGSIDLGDIPITLTGAAVLNLDANHDGQLLNLISGDMASQVVTGQLSLFDLAQGLTSDLRVGLNGQMGLGYDKAGFNFSINIAQASAAYTPDLVAFHGQTTEPFQGTPLQFIKPLNQYDLAGSLDSQGNVTISATASQAILLGFATNSATVTLTNSGVTVADTFNDILGLGQVKVTGGVDYQGNFSLTGTANAGLIGGFATANTQVTASNSGVALATDVTIPGLGQAHLSGSVQSNGQFSLTGSANLTPAGFSMANASLTLSNSGLAVAGSVAIPGLGQASLKGSVQSSGQYTLTGSANLTLAGFSAANASLTLTKNGMAIQANISVLSQSVAFSGSVQANGSFSLTGKANLSLAGFSAASASLTLSNNGMAISAGITVVSQSVAMSGYIQNNGQFYLVGTANLILSGFTANGVGLTLTNSGMTISGNVVVLGWIVGMSGTIQANGQFSLNGANNISVAGYSGLQTFVTLTQAGATSDMYYKLANVSPLLHLHGWILANGQFNLSGAANIGALNNFIDNTSTVVFTNASGMVMTAHLRNPLGWGASLIKGAIGTNSQFSLTANVGHTISGSLGSIGTQVAFKLSNQGNGVSLTGHMTGGFNFSKSGFGISGNLNVNLSFSANGSGGLNVSGSGSFSATLHDPIFGDHTVSVGYSASNSGLTLGFPSPFGNATFSW